MPERIPSEKQENSSESTHERKGPQSFSFAEAAKGIGELVPGLETFKHLDKEGGELTPDEVRLYGEVFGSLVDTYGEDRLFSANFDGEELDALKARVTSAIAKVLSGSEQDLEGLVTLTGVETRLQTIKEGTDEVAWWGGKEIVG